MKNLFFLLLPSIIFAKSFLLSNIPLPKTYIQDIDPYQCDKKCLQDALDHGKIFSFLAKAQQKLDDPKQNEIRTMLISILNLGAIHGDSQLNIALLLPYKKIGKYASSTTNATFAYLITKAHPFMLKSYKVEDETQASLQTAINSIKKDGFDYVIAPLTHTGAINLAQLQPQLHIYIPTINREDINSTSSYFTYGGIDYKAQSDLLLQKAVSPFVIFSDRSMTGKRVSLYQKEQFLEKRGKERVINYTIAKNRTNIESYLKKNRKIKNGSFMINTPIVKSGMIMSQLTLYDVNATNLLSTQINYDPLLLSMTQYIDRKNMIIANSITELNNVLIETNALLSNDIVYDWINYSTTIGVDYFYACITGEKRTYSVPFIDNQMQYNIELLRPTYSKFKRLRRE